jgi:hypothetical protein
MGVERIEEEHREAEERLKLRERQIRRLLRQIREQGLRGRVRFSRKPGDLKADR